MMIRTRWVIVGSAAIILVSSLVAMVFLGLSLKTIGQGRVESEAGLPLVLVPEDQGAGGSRGEILLKGQGVVELDDFPVGEVREDQQNCTDWDGKKTFTGEGKWSSGDDLLITISTAKGNVVIGPYNPARGSVVWYRFGLLLCDSEDVLWYRAPQG